MAMILTRLSSSNDSVWRKTMKDVILFEEHTFNIFDFLFSSRVSHVHTRTGSVMEVWQSVSLVFV